MEPAVPQDQPLSRARTRRSSQRMAWWWRVWVLLPWVVGLGAVTSVIAAAALGVGRKASTFDMYVYSGASFNGSWLGGSWSAADRMGAMYLHITDYGVSVSSPDEIPPKLGDRVEELDRLCEGMLAPHAELLDDPKVNAIGKAEFHIYSAGLPLRCFQGADFPDAWPEPVTIGLIEFGVLDERVICYQPRWIALALDTLFWGAIWMGLILIPLATRRARRRKKGLCPECAYDLRGDLTPGCPECGWNREPAPVSFSS